MPDPLLRLQGLTKAYPGVVANDDVGFDIGVGQVHALLGENGAGKSTLVKMIYGLVKPDKGQMTLRGQPYAPAKPSDARRGGVAMVFQHFSLLIMDEPTSVLTPQEVDILFRTLRQLSAEGTSILYISHKLEEIRALCDEATILRGGKKVATCDPREKSARELAELMVGQVLTPPSRPDRPFGDVVLQVRDLSLASNNPFGTSLRNISFELRAGEVLGIAGVAGNGQDELLLMLSGELPAPAGSVRLRGEGIGALGPNERRLLGLVTAPEERLGHAAAPDMSLTENALLSGMDRKKLTSRGFVDWAGTEAFARQIIARFDVRTPGPHVLARALSGGNLQKFVIGREIELAPDVIVVNQPTWGVDASAAATIRQALLDLATKGAAVLVISQDLDELLEIADSFAALNEGRLTPVRPARGLSVQDIGLMMGGAHGMHPAHEGAA